MKSVARFLLLMGMLIGVIITPALDRIADAAQPPIRIAFIPYENPEQLIDNVRPAVQFLEKQLGRKIKYFITLSYSSAVEALSSGKADISFMAPLPYILAHGQTGAQILLGEIYNGKTYYQSKIYVRKDSGIKTLAVEFADIDSGDAA